MENELEMLFEQIINEELDKNDLNDLPEKIGGTE